MKDWMVPMPDIKSRCGFCGVEMSKWEERTDHLAEHFKSGATMAEWKGGWGFEESTRCLVESAVPPCEFSSCRCTNGNADGTIQTSYTTNETHLFQ
jgi:hypothetical protein